MKNRHVLFLAAVFILGVSSQAPAAVIETEDLRLGINGYLNAKFTYMSEMARDNGGIEKTAESSAFENDTNLLFNVVKDPIRANLNLQFINAFCSSGNTNPALNRCDGEEKLGEFSLLEVFGEFAVNRQLKLRAGHFLSPFGIFNQVRFVTPLFAPVVLPMMYQPPANFASHELVPQDANVMLSGSLDVLGSKAEYFLYGGNGERSDSGGDKNRDKGAGGRLMISLFDHAKLGGSYYSARDEAATEGRHQFYGLDLDVAFRGLNLQAEYVLDDRQKRGNRLSYYARLTHTLGRLNPFIGYDFLKCDQHSLFGRGQRRYSAGAGYRINYNLFLKAEYHYHRFTSTEGFAADAPVDTHMLRGAVIFVF